MHIPSSLSFQPSDWPFGVNLVAIREVRLERSPTMPRDTPAWLRVGLSDGGRMRTKVRLDLLPREPIENTFLGINRSLFRYISGLVSESLDLEPTYLDQNHLIREWDYPLNGQHFTPEIMARNGDRFTATIDTIGFSIADHMTEISAHEVIGISHKPWVLHAGR
jgi:hypothetical protein